MALAGFMALEASMEVSVDYMVLVGSMALGFMDLVASMVLAASMAWEVSEVDF